MISSQLALLLGLTLPAADLPRPTRPCFSGPTRDFQGDEPCAGLLQLFADHSRPPPVVVGNPLYARNGKEVVALPLGGKEPRGR